MTSRAIVCAMLLAVQAREPGPLQKALNDMEPEGDWHYNDLPAGIDAARKSGKPLLVLFRCVP